MLTRDKNWQDIHNTRKSVLKEFKLQCSNIVRDCHCILGEPQLRPLLWRQLVIGNTLCALRWGTFLRFMPHAPHASHGAETAGGNKKLIPHPNPDMDQHQKLIISRGSPLAHAYPVWSMSMSAVVSYPAQRRSHYSANLGGVITLKSHQW